MTWNDLTQRYAKACQISFYGAQADVQQRRQSNGDDEARRWLERFLSGERIAWSDFA